MPDPTITSFLQELAQIRDASVRAVMHFQLQLAMKIQAQTQDNIKATFGKGKGPRSPITERAYGATARRSGRGGGLFQSVNLERDSSGAATVSVGGPGVPYAAIHEFGGTVRPVSSKFLTIPFAARYAGTRARESDLSYGVDPVWGRVLARAGAAPSADGAYEESDIAFLLRRQARIPARPYFAPAIEKVTAQPSVRKVMQDLIGRQKLNVEVV